MLLKRLCETDGVSGDESAVAKLIISEIEGYADEISVDGIGNIIAFKKGRMSNKKVMLSAHTDEVGLIISSIESDGTLKFKTVGGIDTSVLVSKTVRIGEKKVKGVIGMKAVHLQPRDTRGKAPKADSLYIDIGADSKGEAEKHVSLGDYACFTTMYREENGVIFSKAIDDRAGCYILTQLIKNTPCYDTYFCFTTQEEVGLRGSKCAANRVGSDIALVIEATTCSDVGDTKPHERVTTLGGGAAITFMDRTTIVNERYRRWLYDTAVSEGIAVQYKRTTMGGNDAGAIHLTNGGVMTASISVPARYLHSPVSVASRADVESVLKLAALFIDRTDEVI